MTLDEARIKGISRIRLAKWASPNCYLKQHLVKNPSGGWWRGPWLYLYDRCSQESIGIETPQTFLSFNFHCEEENDYEEYCGPIDPEDKIQA